MSDNDLKISEVEYERQSRQSAWIFTIVVHLCALLPLIFITCSPTGPGEELTEIVGWGGSGGNPDVDAPLGPAPQGDPDADGGSRSTTRQEQPTTTRSQTPETPTDRPSTNPTTTDKTVNTPSESGSSQQSSSSTEAQNNNQPGDAKGQPTGEGQKPAGGIGGVTVGDGGLGRCWSVSPRQAASGATTQQEGQVTLRAVVKWDGTVTSISKASGSTTLFSKARTLLSRARACRATPDTPDVPITLTYNFKLN